MRATPLPSSAQSLRAPRSAVTKESALLGQIELGISVSRLAFRNFFCYAAHAGKFSFHRGRYAEELDAIPARILRPRLTFRYTATPLRESRIHRQTIHLMNDWVDSELEAVGEPRPGSKLGSVKWSFVCPLCEQKTDALKGTVRGHFACLNCSTHTGRVMLEASFMALPGGLPN